MCNFAFQFGKTMFTITLTPVIIILFAILLLACIYLLFGFRHYVASVSRKVVDDSHREFPTAPEVYPSVSVIVYSEDDAQNLEVLLPQILNQDYPAPFEVIVVNDGAVKTTKEVVARFERAHSNLYMTFTPLESRSLSRKKLGLTLGIKAARYDVIVNTTGNCQIPSRLWLKALCRNFTPGIEVVIGYGAPAQLEDAKDSWKRLHAFDQVRSAVKYLSWAIAGRPYMGCSANLAYTRSLFFRNKGFSRSLDLRFGDDDVFVSEIANSRNTEVELSADSMVLDVRRSPAAEFVAQKLRYGFTSSKVKGHASAFFGSCTVAWWLSIASAVACSLCGLPSLIPAIASVVLLLITWLVLMLAWRRTSRALWSRKIFLTFPWFMCIRPFYTLYYNFRGARTRSSNLSYGKA